MKVDTYQEPCHKNVTQDELARNCYFKNFQSWKCYQYSVVEIDRLKWVDFGLFLWLSQIDWSFRSFACLNDLQNSQSWVETVTENSARKETKSDNGTQWSWNGRIIIGIKTLEGLNITINSQNSNISLMSKLVFRKWK